MSIVSGWRSKIWRACTATDPITWAVHTFLALVVSVVPASALALPFGSWAVFAVTGKVCNGIFSRFMTGREVADYIRHKAKGDDLEDTVLDGLGDVTGIYLLDLAWLVWIIVLVVR